MFGQAGKRLATSALHWLMASWLTLAFVATPVLSASACDCAISTETSGCCCSGPPASSQFETRGCCSRQSEDFSPASLSGECSCGSSCSCKSERRPTQPAEPLAPEADLSGKIISANAADRPSTTIAMPTIGLLAFPAVAPSVLDSSLERCISLSRFTL